MRKKINMGKSEKRKINKQRLVRDIIIVAGILISFGLVAVVHYTLGDWESSKNYFDDKFFPYNIGSSWEGIIKSFITLFFLAALYLMVSCRKEYRLLTWSLFFYGNIILSPHLWQYYLNPWHWRMHITFLKSEYAGMDQYTVGSFTSLMMGYVFVFILLIFLFIYIRNWSIYSSKREPAPLKMIFAIILLAAVLADETAWNLVENKLYIWGTLLTWIQSAPAMVMLCCMEKIWKKHGMDAALENEKSIWIIIYDWFCARFGLNDDSESDDEE